MVFFYEIPLGSVDRPFFSTEFLFQLMQSSPLRDGVYCLVNFAQVGVYFLVGLLEQLVVGM